MTEEMKYNANQPAVQGKASILTTDVEITFYEKHQLDEALVFLVDNQHEFYFEVEIGDSLTPDKYKLTVVSISWAYNVTKLFKLLENLDYNAGQGEY